MSLDIQFTSYRDDDTLTTIINGKRYKYYNVPPFQHWKMCELLQKGVRGKVVQMLKRYSRPELHKEGEGRCGSG